MLSDLRTLREGRIDFAQRERRRIQRHLLSAERCAREACLAGLDPTRRRVRSLLLAELARYRRRGRFPANPDFLEPTPYFVDARGTRCAVAHLLELGGEAALVRRIATTRNHARVRELADEPRLLAWLEAAGISVAEAARIQPSYCFASDRNCVCPAEPHPVVEAIAVTDSRIDKSLDVRVEAVHAEARWFDVGDEFVVYNIAGVRAGDPLVIHIGTAADGGVQYTAEVFHEPYECEPGAPPLTRRQYAEAVSAEDCEERLIEIDARFAPEQPDCDSGFCGCRLPGGTASDPTPLGILVAVLSTIAARRALRRRASR